MTNLSTKEVAALINVTESTIKRWADENVIPCHRTIGGHRKFSLQDILHFAEKNAYPVSGTIAPPVTQRGGQGLDIAVQTRNYAKIADIFYAMALQADRPAVYELLSYLSKHHIPLATLADLVIRPAMTRIGQEWHDGTLEINREHLASNAVHDGLTQLGPELYRKPAHGRTAVCACLEGNFHELGLRALSISLETEGWKVHYLGADTPLETLRSFIKNERPDIVCISAKIIDGSQRVLRNVQSIGRAAHQSKTTFLLGGMSNGDSSVADFKSDYLSNSTDGALAFLKDRFQLKPGPKKRKH